MTLVSRARPHGANGKPVGRHVETSAHRAQPFLAQVAAPAVVANGKPVGRHVLTSWHRRQAALLAAAALAGRQVVGPRARRRHTGPAVSAVTVMSVSAAIVATVALPSYGVHPSALHPGGLRMDAVRPEPQSFVVSAAAGPVAAVRDPIGATTMEELYAVRAKERALADAKQAALAAAAAGLPVRLTPAAGPEPLLVAAAVPAGAPPAEPGSIVDIARRYLGVRYIFGGASPAGFDCSGLVMFVYSTVGIPLPHSSLRQGANGTRVGEPVPGDLIVIDGGNHIGIYSGDGYMIDAPMPGRVVNERPIYTSNHFFVRY